MKFSLMTEPHFGGTYDQLLDAALWSEAEGLVSFARSDHYMSGATPTPDATDAFATLAGLARDTTTIRLCVLVSPITFRHPAVILKNAISIDQMSEGRFDLGVGTGWYEMEHAAFGLDFPDWKERFDRFEETLDYLEAGFGENPADFTGKHYSLTGDIRPKPQGMRLVIGGSGPKRTPTLAGTRADEYNFFTCLPDDARPKIEVMKAAAGDRNVEVTVMGPALVARTDDVYRDRLAAAAAKGNRTPEEQEELYVSRGFPIGTPGRVGETLAALEAVGVERMYVQWLDLTDPDTMKDTVEILRSV